MDALAVHDADVRSALGLLRSYVGLEQQRDTDAFGLRTRMRPA